MTLVRLGKRHIGWQRDGAVVANVRMARQGDELTVLALEYEDDADGADLMRTVADVATGKRILGDDERLGGFGFERADGRWVRELRVKADDEASAFVTLAELEAAIRDSWSRETTESPDEWSEDNPAWGNCAVTAMVVRDYLGGDLVIGGVVRDGVRVDRHVWNVLPSGLAVDLSRDQFRNGERCEAPQPLTETTVPGTQERHELLAARVREKLGR